MKRYILSYTFNGVDHTAEVQNVAGCLESLCLASQAGTVEHVTFASK